MYGFGTAYGRQLKLNLPLRMLVPFGESVLDLAARFPYPVRTAGDRVVMISAPVANANPRSPRWTDMSGLSKRGWGGQVPGGFTGCVGRFWACRAKQSWGCAWEAHPREAGKSRRGRVEDCSTATRSPTSCSTSSARRILNHPPC